MSIRQDSTTQTVVAIIGTDPVVGQALESLLQSSGYGTRFVTYPVTDESRNMFADAHLVLLMPELSNMSHKRFLISKVSTVAMTNIPILELVSEPNEAYSLRTHPVRWPCRLEQLRREILHLPRSALS
jgi:hypothetical protein